MQDVATRYQAGQYHAAKQTNKQADTSSITAMETGITAIKFKAAL
jgi:hypothetical protein